MRGRKGQVIVGFALTAAVLLAMIGLAIDLGMAYLVKAKLSAAVDAAALAAGKVAAQGESVANAEAGKFFATNYPDGFLGAAVATPATTLDYDQKDKSWTVTVSTTATIPAYFAKVVGRNNFTVGASATTTIGPVDLVLVLDTSATLNQPDPQTFTALKEAACGFIDQFTPESDRIGLIRFASGAEEDFKITGKRGFDKNKIKEKLGPGLTASGYTTAEEALRLAKEQLDSIPKNDQSRRRIIVFFTDGAPNGVAANYLTNLRPEPFAGVVSSQTSEAVGLEHLYRIDRVNSDLKYGAGNVAAKSLMVLPEKDWTGTVELKSFNNIRQLMTSANGYLEQKCNVNMAARNMTENVANAARSETGAQGEPITIFAIGLGKMLTMSEITCAGYGSSEYGENILRRLANVPGADTYNPNQPSGLYAFAKDPTQLKAAFNSVARSVLRLSK